jgi:ribosomal protein L32
VSLHRCIYCNKGIKLNKSHAFQKIECPFCHRALRFDGDQILPPLAKRERKKPPPPEGLLGKAKRKYREFSDEQTRQRLALREERLQFESENFKCPNCGEWCSNEARYCEECGRPFHNERELAEWTQRERHFEAEERVQKKQAVKARSNNQIGCCLIILLLGFLLFGLGPCAIFL